jgi:hypothetical protein
MTTIVSIAELQQAGVTLEAGEAVAVAQQLIQTLRHRDDAGVVEPPYGPPTAANVILNADGSVSCAACGTTPAIFEIAIFLDALLPAGSAHVPGGLRYTIARGLLEVDVAPFDSLDDFSKALTRHETGPRGEVVRRLLRRAESARAFAPGGRNDRRRARTTELRRALREADAQLYARQVAAATPLAAPPIRRRAEAAVAVCLGSGMMLIATGEFMQGRPPKAEPAPVVRAAAQPVPAIHVQPVQLTQERGASGQATARQVSADQSAPSPRRAMAGPASAIQPASRAADSSRPVPRVWPEPREQSDRVLAKRTARSSTTIRSAHAPHPGVMDRLRLRWLRNAFSIRADDL